jgi:hypothetical protein
MKRKLVLFSAVLAFLGTAAFAQSRFVEDKRGAFGLSGGFSGSEDSTGISADLGLSFLGAFDIGAGFGKVFFKEKFFGEDISAGVFEIGARFFPVKQNEEIPLSLSLGIGLGFAGYDSKALDDAAVEMTAGMASFGITLYHSARISRTLRIQPSAGISYISTTVKLEDSYGDSLEDDDSRVSFGADLAFIFGAASAGKFVLVPGFSADEDGISVGIGFGYIGGF